MDVPLVLFGYDQYNSGKAGLSPRSASSEKQSGGAGENDHTYLSVYITCDPPLTLPESTLQVNTTHYH